MIVKLRTPFARAVVPVVAGLAFFALLGLATWGIAAFLSRNPDRLSESFASSEFEVGRIEPIAELIADSGPLLFPDLLKLDGARSVVLDHTGDDPRYNWTVYYAYPADRDAACKVTQVRHTRRFTDCEGRTIEVEQLALPEGVVPVVGNTVTIDLSAALRAEATPATTAT